MPPRCALKRGASGLITMTMGTVRRGPTLDTACRMTAMTFSSQIETGGFDVLKCGQMDGVTAALSKLLGSLSSHFVHRQGALCCFFNRRLRGRAFHPDAFPGSRCFCLSVWVCAVHEVKGLISSCRAIHWEPLYSMGPFGAIVRVATIALCFDTLHTGPEWALEPLLWMWSVAMFATKILTYGHKLNFCTATWPACRVAEQRLRTQLNDSSSESPWKSKAEWRSDTKT